MRFACCECLTMKCALIVFYGDWPWTEFRLLYALQAALLLREVAEAAKVSMSALAFERQSILTPLLSCELPAGSFSILDCIPSVSSLTRDNLAVPVEAAADDRQCTFMQVISRELRSPNRCSLHHTLLLSNHLQPDPEGLTYPLIMILFYLLPAVSPIPDITRHPLTLILTTFYLQCRQSLTSLGIQSP